jgi:L-alanine-DL-glutamate epimerase-like enolase superfamily enzyme
MKHTLTRRNWITLAGGAAIAAALPRTLRAAAGDDGKPLIRDYEQPMFGIPAQIAQPVRIASVELLRGGSNYFVRTRSTDGAEGLVATKQMAEFVPLFEKLVAPHFVGKDARDIEALVDSVYRDHYKNAGLPFWCPVAYVEQSLLDMLGKVARKPVAALFGGAWRDEVPVYLSGSARTLSAEEEVAVYVRGVAETGAKAVKFKIGGRMSRNLDAAPGRTEKILRLAREKLGPDVALMTDANGSYDPEKAIELGRIMESLNYAFFEEPCPWEYVAETRQVAKALKIPVAFGEQNWSLSQFEWMLKNGVMRIVQPDINYNGGLIRAKRVARMAEKLGYDIVPHNTQTGATSVNILQFAACTRNARPHMEYPWRAPQKTASWYKPDFKIVDGKIRVPQTPGMGVEFDPDFINKAGVIAKITHTGKASW